MRLLMHRLRLIGCALFGHRFHRNKAGAPLAMTLALKGHRPLPCGVCSRCLGAWPDVR